MSVRPKASTAVHLYPTSLYQDLEMDRVLHAVRERAVNEAAGEYIASLRPMGDPSHLQKALREVVGIKSLIESGAPLPIQQVEDISGLLKLLKKAGYVLDTRQLKMIAKVLRTTRHLVEYGKEYIEDGSILSAYYAPLSQAPQFTSAIDDVLDEQFDIRPDATPELQRISQQIESTKRKLNRVFERSLQQYSANGWLKDTQESIKSGFRVLAVRPEFKRQIPGLLLDESTSGQTFYIAPQSLIEHHNELQHLEADYQREIYNILQGLSQYLRTGIEDIQGYYPVIIRLDVLHAKAQYAQHINGHAPKISSKQGIKIIGGVHPVLYEKNKRANKTTVPFDLILDEEQRILLTSGPNAGGKSIMMKAAGLLQLMTQCALLPPVDPSSELGIFRRFMVDIGDHQSIEEDLSTYSSHLKNMAMMLRHARHDTLILLDEFGSGTDPVFGGALAESILYNFIRRKCIGVITTHYSNLKIFAAKNKGIFNGAMMFDKDKLTPTYQFQAGHPGSSFAFEIARKSGLPDPVIRAARKKAGQNQTEVEDLLLQLRQETGRLEEQISAYAHKGKKLDQLIRQYDLLKHELFIKKKKLSIQEQELKLEYLAEKREALNKLLLSFARTPEVKSIQKEVADVIEQQEQTSSSLRQSIDEVYYRDDGEATALQIGDHVQLKIGGMKGVISAIRNKTATVDCDAFTLQSQLKDLARIPKPLQKGKGSTHRVSLESKRGAFNPKLDIRGMGRSDALEVLQDFVDEALLAGAFEISILHGKGNGVLKLAVRQKLTEYSDISRVFHPPPEQGGEGITIVQF